jgi:hypothetical protein
MCIANKTHATFSRFAAGGPTIRTGVFMRGGFEVAVRGLASGGGIMEERVSPQAAKHYVAGISGFFAAPQEVECAEPV